MPQLTPRLQQRVDVQLGPAPLRRWQRRRRTLGQVLELTWAKSVMPTMALSPSTLTHS